MGYSRSKKVIVRHLEQLEALAEAKETRVFPTEAPGRLAYKLREAVYACQFHEEYKKLHRIHFLFAFKEEADQVVAEYKAPPNPLIPKATGSPNVKSAQEPVEEEEADPTPQLLRRSVSDAYDLMDVLGATMASPEVEEFHFPNATLPLDEKKLLFNWAKEKEWNYIDHDDAGLTITKAEVPEEILWKAP